MAKKPPRPLTPVELEIMSIVWRLSEATVRDVLGELPKGRELAYTSVSTVLRILESKAVLESEKRGRGHVYRPLVSKADYERSSVDQLAKKVFATTPAQLVRRLVDEADLSVEDIKALRAILAQKLAQQRSDS